MTVARESSVAAIAEGKDLEVAVEVVVDGSATLPGTVTTAAEPFGAGEPIDLALDRDASESDPDTANVDPCARYALEHSGLGPSDLVRDCVGLLTAAILVAGARAVSHTAGHLPFAVVFGTTLLGLTLCVPVLTAFLTGSRRRSVLNGAFSDQVQSLALPLSAGALAALAMWRAASAAFGLSPPAFDCVLGMCVVSVTTVSGVRVLHRRLGARTQRNTQRVIIVGSGSVADRVADELARHRKVDIAGYVDDDPMDPTRCLGPLRALPAICLREGVRHVVVAFSRSHPSELVDALRPVLGRLRVTVVPRLFELLPPTTEVHEIISGLAGFSVAPTALGPWHRMVKRVLDLVGAGLGLFLLAPFLCVVAIAVRLSSPGPAFYRQMRMGRNGEMFSMVKFRTMRTETCDTRLSGPAAEIARGEAPKVKGDPRVTSLGRVLRRTSVDELPNLWNVFRGDMSLVGPRPVTLHDTAVMKGWAFRRYSVRPGITGLWQVAGRSDLTFEDMYRLDQLYVNCWSIGLDLRTLLRTFWAVTSGRGAY